MNAVVSLDELRSAFEWVSAGDGVAVECEAFVGRATGGVHWRGEGIDEPIPDDIDDGSQYIAVPHRNEFDLGRSLVLRFVNERLPRENEAVYGYFRQRGAYAKFKSLLEREGLLEAWFDCERVAIETALREWCAENGFALAP